MFKIPTWIIIVIALNVAALIIMLRPNPNVGVPPLNLPSEVNNQTLNKSSNQQPNTSNQTLTLNTSYYNSKCVGSISNYIKGVENITNFTTIETRFFNKTGDAIDYVTNLSNKTYELMGIGKDIYSLIKSVVSLNIFKTKDGKSFTLPIVCDESGIIRNYSSCILSNISNITLYCHNITQNISECDIEEAEHGFWDDITYLIEPKPGTLNTSQKFNFTITSSRNRLEYATLNVYYVRPPITYQALFNQSKATTKGDIISITTTLNLTGKTFGGLVVETYFKKKCYKYTLISQYMY